MLVRIVKMEFEKDKIEVFKELFDGVKDKIRHFEGCQNLELYQELSNPYIFFTYSYWKSEDALEGYRKSELFKKTWSETKVMFSNKPEAWSVEKTVILP